MTDIFAQSLGLVQEGDKLSLSAGLVLQRYSLVDTATSARHRLSRGAYHALDLLQHAIPVDLWLQSAAVKKLGNKRAATLLYMLDELSALQVQRTVWSGLGIRVKRLGLVLRGLPLVHNVKRCPASWESCVVMAVQAAWSALIWAALVSILAYGANIPFGRYVLLQSIFLGTVVASTILHEAAHWQALGSDRQRAVIVRRGLRLGLLHRPLAARQELLSAVAGPLVGVLAGMVLAAAIYGIGQDGYLSVMACLAGLLHIISWLPWYGDGAALRASLKAKTKSKAQAKVTTRVKDRYA